MRREINGFKYFYYSELNPFDMHLYFTKVYSFLKMLTLEYTSFQEWYNKLFITDYDLSKEREIIICQYNHEIAGVAILKKHTTEDKICTLRVSKEFQRNGIGKKLVELSIEWLENDKPLITLSRSKQKEFASLLKYYNFNLEQKRWGYYSVFSTELTYNGELPLKNILLNKFEIFDVKKAANELIEYGCFDFSKMLERCIEIWWQRENRKYRLINNSMGYLR